MAPRLYALAADAVVVAHLLFIVFVVLGAALLPRWPRLAWLHGPALAWGVYVELSGAVCPLTPLENHLRALAGAPGYGGGFIDHHVLPLLYPAQLTPGLQALLALGVVVVNVALYGRWLARRTRRGRTP
jgi:hypothetical protein